MKLAGDAEYRGETLNNKPHGKGSVTWPDGSRYSGDWKEGLFHGEGTFTWTNGDKYEGHWYEDRMHGRGTYLFADWRKYDGEWRHDQMHGFGTYYWPNGEKYEGEFAEGLYEGLERILGLMAKYTADCGITLRVVVKGKCSGLMAEVMKETLLMTKEKAWALCVGLTAENIVVTGLTVGCMEKVLTILLMAPGLKANLKRVLLLITVNTIFRMMASLLW
jgi:hypothetical protein